MAIRERVAALRDRVLVLGDDAYPPLLEEIIDPPLALHFRGDVALLARWSGMSSRASSQGPGRAGYASHASRPARPGPSLRSG